MICSLYKLSVYPDIKTVSYYINIGDSYYKWVDYLPYNSELDYHPYINMVSKCKTEEDLNVILSLLLL